MQAAIAYENDTDIDSAKQVLGAIVSDYADSSAEVPRALFSLGRISEVEDAIADASDYYNRLVDDYPTSSWTNLARDRIITLTVQGRIGS
jgi:TolA-binding protein